LVTLQARKTPQVSINKLLFGVGETSPPYASSCTSFANSVTEEWQWWSGYICKCILGIKNKICFFISNKRLWVTMPAYVCPSWSRNLWQDSPVLQAIRYENHPNLLLHILLPKGHNRKFKHNFRWDNFNVLMNDCGRKILMHLTPRSFWQKQ
jgi:hypothetical protein